MSEQDLSGPCPICGRGELIPNGREFQCQLCGAVLQSQSVLNLLRKDTYKFVKLGDDYQIAQAGLRGRLLSRADLAALHAHIYTDAELAAFAQGDLSGLREPEGTLASIIFEQLREQCVIQVNGLRRALGPPLDPGADYVPTAAVSRSGFRWQDRGNLFATEQRLVFPSDTFTFIRMDRKLVGVRAFHDALAIQRKTEEEATYFVGCTAYQAALLAAYVQGRLPHLQQVAVET